MIDKRKRRRKEERKGEREKEGREERGGREERWKERRKSDGPISQGLDRDWSRASRETA